CRICWQSNPRAGVLPPFAGRDKAYKQTLGGRLMRRRQVLVELVGAFLQCLLEPGILAEADLRASPLSPGLLERVLEQWQLADVVLAVPAGRHVEGDGGG